MTGCWRDGGSPGHHVHQPVHVPVSQPGGGRRALACVCVVTKTPVHGYKRQLMSVYILCTLSKRGWVPPLPDALLLHDLLAFPSTHTRHKTLPHLLGCCCCWCRHNLPVLPWVARHLPAQISFQGLTLAEPLWSKVGLQVGACEQHPHAVARRENV